MLKLIESCIMNDGYLFVKVKLKDCQLSILLDYERFFVSKLIV